MCTAGLAKLSKCLREHRALVVLDDVDDMKSQSNMPLPQQRDLHPGSRVIVTSRNSRVLEQRCDAISEVSLLPKNLAEQLLLHMPFGRASLPWKWLR